MTIESVPLPHFHSGKVRDTYWVPGHPDLLLMVASDRISTHNVKHLSLVPSKGQLLNAQTIFWEQGVLVEFCTHLFEWGKVIYEYLPRLSFPADLHYRAVLVRRYTPDPREFIWRNYLTGSLWELYRQKQDPYGVGLRQGLPKMHHFAKPLFTPTQKSENDEPVHAMFARQQYPKSMATTYDAFDLMTAYLARRGITLIDGKFEAADGVLIDEWGTGDCCRFAWTKDVQEGQDPPWLDKENFRQAAVRMWNGGPRIPLTFSPHDIEAGVRKYHEAFESITDMSLSDFQNEYLD